MAFNGYRLNYPTTRVVPAESYDADDRNALLSDTQAAWVLFNPDDESDILSFTNTGTSQSHHERDDVSSQAPSAANSDETDSLIDNLTHDDTPAQSRLEQLFHKNPLSLRIDRWKDQQDEYYDDNTAAWDLDENLSINNLDRSILARTEFYGDHLFSNMSRAEYKKFRHIEQSLRKYLTRKPNDVVHQVLAGLVPPVKPQPSQYHKLLNEIISKHYRQTHHIDHRSVSSDASASSLVICGPEGSWGDV